MFRFHVCGELLERSLAARACSRSDSSLHSRYYTPGSVKRCFRSFAPGFLPGYLGGFPLKFALKFLDLLLRLGFSPNGLTATSWAPDMTGSVRYDTLIKARLNSESNATGVAGNNSECFRDGILE